ncbi:FecR domain-containing protein [bacterium]|nr:FecR domain-containing protein [bacterium]
MKFLRIPFLALSILAMSAISAHAAQIASAKITAVEGVISKSSLDGSVSPLALGDILIEGDIVNVAELSTVTLVFSNGSEIVIQENSSLNIAKLQQEPFSGNQSYEQLQADPSKSQVLLELSYGELDGHVKSLRSGSTFEVDTPLGTASIRGTTFKVSYITIQNGAEVQSVVFSVENKEGRVSVAKKTTTVNADGSVTVVKSESEPVEPGQKSSNSCGPENVVLLKALVAVIGEVVETIKTTSATVTNVTVDAAAKSIVIEVETPVDPDIIVVSPEGQATTP